MKTIRVSKGKYLTLVSDRDFRQLSKYSWHVIKERGGTKYAATSIKVNGRYKRVLMHRMIMGEKLNFLIDHADGNGLNNTRENLRFCTYAQNNANSKVRSTNRVGFKGVKHIDNPTKPWLASIKHEGQQIYLGQYARVEDAARAYNEAAKKYYGEFARLNVLPRHPVKRHLIRF